MRAPTCSHETFGSSNMPLQRLDEETVREPPSAVSANSTWASAGQVLDSYGYQEDDEETSVILQKAIRVKNDVGLERAVQT